MDELKPCPFCGGCEVEGRESITDYYVACCNCGARTGLVYLGPSAAANAANMAKAIAAWNTRTPSRNDVLEEAALIVDQCNREGPYNAIGAAERIRARKDQTDG